jgi:hypothetical protein
MPTSRALYTAINNALDFLLQSELAIAITPVALRDYGVSWHPSSDVPFLPSHRQLTAAQYLEWAKAGQYSAALPDGALLQLTYELRNSEIVGHRLAYVPCPVLMDDPSLLLEWPIGEVVEMYLDAPRADVIALKSMVRFDFDPSAARHGHPAAHLTINHPNCRIACVAPMHPYRFIEFVYRHFYADLRAAQVDWFDELSDYRLGKRVLSDEESGFPHMMWPYS